MNLGYSSQAACRIVGVNYRTGKRWRNGARPTGRHKWAPPVAAVPAINALNVLFLQANLHSSASLCGTIVMSEGIGGVLGTMGVRLGLARIGSGRVSAGELCAVLEEFGLAQSNSIQDDQEERVTSGGFSSKRLTRVRDVLSRHLDAGYVPGAVAVVARHGEVHIEAMGNLAFDGEGSRTPMAADTIWRTGSMTKPIVAACAMTLVEDCTLRLDDPVDEFLPELADMTVLADPNGPLEDTVPAERPITLRDLLTFTLGTGIVPAEPGTIPIADALNALLGEEPGPPPDEWIRRLGELPLVYQPGERWMYHTAASVTGVLIARATGMSFGEVLRERICEPLGMKDTAFSVAGENIGRLATAYQRDDATGEIVVEDGPDGYWSRPPAFEDGGGGLVCTADDYLAFASALLAGGARHGERVLSRPSVTLMTSDHLTPAQKAVSGFAPGYFDDIGWGFGMSVRTRRAHLGPWSVSYPPLASVGSYGWSGIYGTGWCNDPAEDMTTILMIQRAPAPPALPILFDFWTAAYQAIDD